MSPQDSHVTPLGQISRPLFIIWTVIMVLVWCFQVGWFTGFGYLLGFSFVKRWTVMGITNAVEVEDEDGIKAMHAKIVGGLAVVHMVQLLILVLVVRRNA